MPPEYQARFIVDVIAQLDLSAIYLSWASQGLQIWIQAASVQISWLQALGIDPYVATGRTPHHESWCTYFQEALVPPADDASAKEQMAYKLRTKIGTALYRLRKSTVEPVIGIIKEVIGFRQFSLRGLRLCGEKPFFAPKFEYTRFCEDSIVFTNNCILNLWGSAAAFKGVESNEIIHQLCPC